MGVCVLAMPSFAPENPRIKIVHPNVARSNGKPELLALKEALEDALQAADPIAIINHDISLEGTLLHVKSTRVDLSEFDKILVIGGGKASGKMAFQIETLLGDKITAGVVNIPM
jgi:glycerate 2-kinase